MINNYDNYYNYMYDYNNLRMLNNYNNMTNYYEPEQSTTSLAEPYRGYIQGNLFNNLYNPYKGYKPAELKPKNEQEETLLMIKVFNFAAHELNLYLTNHPKDVEAMRLRDEYLVKAKNAQNEYENSINPIYSNKLPREWTEYYEEGNNV